MISDVREGLKAATRRAFGAGSQRCRVCWMPNALADVPKTQQSMVAAALRQAFLLPDRVRLIGAMLLEQNDERRLPSTATMHVEAMAELVLPATAADTRQIVCAA